MSDAYSSDASQQLYNPVGFAQKQISDYDAQAREFLKTIPGQYKPQMDEKLLSLRGRIYSAATGFERDENDKLVNIKTNNGLNALLDQGVANPAQYAQRVTEGERLIDNAPNSLTGGDREETKQKWREKAAEAYGITQYRDNPTGLAQASGIAPGTQSAGRSIADKIIGVESGGVANAKNPLSSATGLGQFIAPTWLGMIRKYRPDLAGESDDQLLALRNDPGMSREMTQHYADENAAYLKGRNLPVSDGALYLAHFAGPEGAAKILGASPNTPIGQVLGQGAVSANPFLRGMSAGGVVAWADHKMHGAPTATGPTEQHPQYFNIIGENVDPNLKALPFEKRLQLYEQVVAGHNGLVKQQQEDFAKTVTERKGQLDLGIETGRVTSASTILNDPLIHDDDKAVLLRRFNERNKAGFDATALIQTINSGGFVDQTDGDVKKALNRILADNGGATGLIKGDQNALATTLSLWDKAHIVPDDAKQALTGMVGSKDGNVVMRGMQQLDQLQRMNPVAFAQTFNNEELQKSLVTYQTRLPYDGAQGVVQQIQRRYDPEWIKSKEPLEKQGLEQAQKTYDTAKVVGLFGSSWFGPDQTPKIAGDAQSLTDDFRKLYADAFAETGDPAQAQAQALTLLQRVWGPSALNGGAIMRNPPEHYYSIKGQRMRDALDSGMKRLGYTETHVAGPSEALIGSVTNVRPYSIRAIPLTEAQIAAGQPPQYVVMVTAPDGRPDAVHDKDGAVFLFPDSQFVQREQQKEGEELTKKLGQIAPQPYSPAMQPGSLESLVAPAQASPAVQPPPVQPREPREPTVVLPKGRHPSPRPGSLESLRPPQ